MDIQMETVPFDRTVSCLEKRWQEILLRIPPERRSFITEVRFRSGRPVAITTMGRTAFITGRGEVRDHPDGDLLLISQQELEQIVSSLCDYSVHTHSEEIKNGFITLPTGSRAGICGQAVAEENHLLDIRGITSVNIRIPREVPGVADPVVEWLLQSNTGIILSGPPASGKTTMLKDLIDQLASPSKGCHTVAVADERGELTLGRRLPITADILLGYPKHIAILQAVRTLSPEYVVCDEIGTPEEVEAVSYALGCGVKIITSLHAGNIAELRERKIARSLLSSGAFGGVFQLSSSRTPCKVYKFYSLEEAH